MSILADSCFGLMMTMGDCWIDCGVGERGIRTREDEGGVRMAGETGSNAISNALVHSLKGQVGRGI